jgi:protein-L-isoaspartate(D-aspartate) O-methyltransferase
MPATLFGQLAVGGRMVVPVGSLRDQWLEVVVRGDDGPEVVRSVACRFVPLVGAAGFDESQAG